MTSWKSSQGSDHDGAFKLTKYFGFLASALMYFKAVGKSYPLNQQPSPRPFFKKILENLGNNFE